MGVVALAECVPDDYGYHGMALTAGCTSLGLGCAEEEPHTCLAFAELELLLLAGAVTLSQSHQSVPPSGCIWSSGEGTGGWIGRLQSLRCAM